MLNKPHHTFLLSLFFVIHVVNSYYGLIELSIIVGFLFTYLLITLLILLSGFWIFKNFLKAGIWTTILLLVFFFFGSAHDLLKSNSILPGLFSKYLFILPTIFLTILCSFFYLKRSKQAFLTANKYLNALFVILVFIELFSLTYKMILGKERENNLASYNLNIFDSLKVSTEIKPDIFFIVFDEYASSLSLEKYLHFNNSELDKILRQNNFYIAPKSKSNYNSTPFSLGSTFSLDYFNRPLKLEKTVVKLRLQAFSSLKNSQLFSYFSSQGYHIHNFGLVSIRNYPVDFKEFSTDDKIMAFYRETLWGRIEKDIWWNIQILFNSNPDEKNNNIAFKKNLKNFEYTLKELKIQNDTPKFVFLHVMMPHRPFVVDSTGRRINPVAPKHGSLNEDSLYINQVVFTNKWIKALAIAANKSFSRPRVVIIEGDHGWRDLNISQETIYDKEFMNLNSYFFSDNDYRLLYDSISPVNSFRIVLNKYFGTALPLLKDSSILLD